MSRFEALSENVVYDPHNIGVVEKNILSHPARSSMGQSLAGKGELVFEGELLEMPLSWHPSRTRH